MFQSKKFSLWARSFESELEKQVSELRKHILFYFGEIYFTIANLLKVNQQKVSEKGKITQLEKKSYSLIFH